MGVLDAIGGIVDSMFQPRVTVVDRSKVEGMAEEIYERTSLSTHEACVLAATIEGWDAGDIGWLIGRSTMTVQRIQRNLRKKQRENRGGLEGRLLAKM